MAVTDQWPILVNATGGSSGTYVWSGGNYTLSPPSIAAYSGGYSTNAPRELTALEWLDAETEKVCKLARLAS